MHTMTDFATLLLWASVWLSGAALVARGLIWLLRPASPGVQQILWMLVLVQGVVLLRVPVEIPWYRSDSTSLTENQRSSDLLHAAPSWLERNRGPGIVPLPDRRGTAPAGVAGRVDFKPTSRAQATARFTRWNWSGVALALLWAAGIAGLVAEGLIRYLRFLARLSPCRPPDPEWMSQWRALLSDHGINKPISLRVTANVGPAICFLPSGYSVVVPEVTWRGLSNVERLAILRHELAHYQRGDLWILLLVRLLAVVHWFNPLAWWAFLKFQECTEWACDRTVAQDGNTDATVFARALIRLGGGHGRLPSCASGVRGGKLFVRIHYLLSSDSREDSVMKKTAVFTVALTLIVGSLVRVNIVAKEAEAEAVKRESQQGRETSTTSVPAGATGDLLVRRIWAGPEVDTLGQPSTDGRNLPFTDWETGDLAVRDLTTRQNRRLTDKGTWTESDEYAESSVPSPSGKRIAYAWWNKDSSYDLRTIELDGSNVRVIFENPEVEYIQPHSWSADETEILALITRHDKTNEIALISVADGSVRVLKTLDWRYPAIMRLAPDGQYVAYDFPPLEESPKRDIYLLATDGSRETPLVQHPADDLFPIWAPDGDSIFFSSDRTGSPGTWAIRVADGLGQGTPQLIKRDVDRRSVPLGFTKNGSYFYGVPAAMSDVYTGELDLESGEFVNPPTRAVERFQGSNTSAAWSRDGNYLAYVSKRGRFFYAERGTTFLTIRSLQTGKEREMALDVDVLLGRAGLDWSPDGRSIMVVANDKGRQGLHRIDVQTGQIEPIVLSEPGEYIFPGEWSSDGKTVFFHHLEPATKGSRIVARHLETGRETELYRVNTPVGANGLAVSPDGRHLVFLTNHPESKTVALMTVPSDGGEPRELVRLMRSEFIMMDSFKWTSDGNEILYGKRVEDLRDQAAELWRVPFRGGEPRMLNLTMDGLTGLSVHPDGRRIALSAGGFNGEVWMMDNALTEKLVAAR